MERLLIAAGLTLVAVGAALVLQRTRRPASITTPGPHGARLPQALERHDFPTVAAPWLVAVFSSATCQTCASVVATARALASPEVGVVDVEWGAARELHRRYGIDAVPALAIADEAGNVLRWILGPVSAATLRQALTDVRAATPVAPAEQPVDLRGRDDRPAPGGDAPPS